ncbi:hypothetical protein COP2_004898 [Malus domestica]
MPKAVKLRCSFCDALFSASNPSRTTSEHLKLGTCPNFNSLAKPISSLSPSSTIKLPSSPAPVHHTSRKRSLFSVSILASTSYHVPPLAIVVFCLDMIRWVFGWEGR